MSRSNSAAPLPALPMGYQQKRLSDREISHSQPPIQISKSVQNLHEQQHTYQNHRPSFYGAPPSQVQFFVTLFG